MSEKTTLQNDIFFTFRAVFDNLPHGLHIYHLEDINDDSTLRMVRANQAAADLTGVPVRDLVGKTLDENFPKLRDIGIPQKYAEVVRSGEPITMDDVYYSDDRVIFRAFAVKAFPLPDNCVGVLFDNITERRKAEDDLAKSKAQLQSLFDNMLSGFAYHQIITNERGEPVDYIFLDVNSSFEQLTGLKREDILGRKMTEVHPDIRNTEFDWIGTYGKVALTGESIIFEQYFKPPNKWYLISAYCPRKGYFAVTFNDITDSKMFDDRLRENEERYRALFTQMPSGGVVYEAVKGGKDFIIKELNRSAEKIENIAEDEVTGRRLTNVFPGVKEFGLLDVLERVWMTGKAEFMPATVYIDEFHVDSWRENWVYKLPSGDIVSVFNDVTLHKKREEQLRDAILRQKEIAKAGNVGLWDWDLETNQVTYSAEWKRQIGYEEYEISDDFAEWESRVHPDDLEPLLEQIKQTIARLRQDHIAEFRFRHKDGSYRWILTQSSVILNESGEAIRMLGSHVDITDRKLMEDEQQRTAQQLTSLVDNLLDSVVVTSLNGVIRFVNNAACLFFGRKKNDLIGIELGLPVDEDKIFEITAHLPNAEMRYAEAKSAVINWDNEHAYLISLRDITEIKHAEAENEKINMQMTQAQKMESIGNLAGGIAHDFNNMLSVILGYGEELVNALESTDPLRQSAQEIVEAGRRSAELTRQLLAFSRRQTLRLEVLDLNDIIRSLENVLRRLIEENVELTTVLTEGPASVEVDPGQLEQVIINLVVNARDAMSEGGKIIIEIAEVELTDKHTGTYFDVMPGEYVMLSVSDNGCGMDEAIRTKVFEPFYTTKEKGKGTGLGLSTVYGIVKQSRGYIWVYSEPGQGTTFKIYLPKTTGKLSVKKKLSNADSIEGNGEMILVVEDEPSLRKLCERILKSLNYKVTTAANGKEALLLLEEKKFRPDLVITDVIMPEMGGKDLIHHLRTLLPYLKFLYMSGYTDNAIVNNGTLDSGVPFIQKPFSKGAIGKMIRSILDGA